VYSQRWMKRVVTAAVLIPLVLLLVFLGPVAVAFHAGSRHGRGAGRMGVYGLAEKGGANPPRAAVLVLCWPCLPSTFNGQIALRPSSAFFRWACWLLHLPKAG